MTLYLPFVLQSSYHFQNVSQSSNSFFLISQQAPWAGAPPPTLASELKTCWNHIWVICRDVSFVAGSGGHLRGSKDNQDCSFALLDFPPAVQLPLIQQVVAERWAAGIPPNAKLEIWIAGSEEGRGISDFEVR